jgi:predicted nucleic acid-binding protein
VLRYIKANHTLILSDYILDEALRTTKRIANKYKIPKRDQDLWSLHLPYLADEMIVLPETFQELNVWNIRDANDVGVFATVLLSRSHLLISNDKDLLHNEAIRKYITVVKLEEFETCMDNQIPQEQRDLLERMVKKFVMIGYEKKSEDVT